MFPFADGPPDPSLPLGTRAVWQSWGEVGKPLWEAARDKASQARTSSIKLSFLGVARSSRNCLCAHRVWF